MTLRALAALLLLAGCPYVGQRTYEEEIKDYDGDGVIGTRFGGEDCRDDDPTITICDVDGDGHDSEAAGGDDCDDEAPLVFPGADERCNGIDDDCDGAVDDADDVVVDAPTWYADDDADGYGSPDEALQRCTAPPNHVDDARDCDDDRADVHPGAVEFCDALDRDCNGDPIDNAVDPVDWYTDSDGDGFGFGPSVALACEGPAGTADNADDCDDSSNLAYPGAVEVWYDGVDADCDGASDFDQDGDGHDRMPEGGDCDDTNPARSPGAAEVCNGGVDDDCDGVGDNDDPSVAPGGQWTYFLDTDGDAFGDPNNARLFCPNTAPAGWVLIGGDCDDTLSSVLPGGNELCDSRDNDCDGVVDDGAVGMVSFYVDGDGDGYGGPTTQLACAPGPGLVLVDGDCNDGDPQTYPGAPEICGDLFRQDCSALSVDDCDSDGFVDIYAGGTDCDDSRDDVYPGANEVCDGHDNNCNGLFDDDDPLVDLSTVANWYTDADGDGFGGPILYLPNACAPIPGAAPNNSDCDDADPDTWPGATELCDGIDNSCEGTVDEGPILFPPVFHYDADGDGYGNPLLAWAQGCTPPGPEWVLDDRDCNDSYAAVNPFAIEICDGLDNDCDGLLDSADPSAAVSLWYQDDDGDGYGQSGSVLSQCAQPMGYAALNGDCNDFEPATNPGADEVCDGGIDNDCDGLGDDADPDLDAAVTWHPDADGDGFGDPNQTQIQCSQPAGWVNNGTDCDDTRASISPAAIELCDAVDNDCNGLADDADPGVVGASFWFPDLDGDAWGDLGSPVLACFQPPGMLPQGGDCDDSNSSIFPGAPERCDGIDNDCDLLIDDADPSVLPTTWYADADGDGAGNAAVTLQSCADPGVGWAPAADDCDDANPARWPGATEVCNGLDDDCDGQVDDDDPGATGLLSWYLDGDDDGFGDPLIGVSACQGGPSYVDNDGDCDDAEPRANPGQPLELCNGFDDDCDGLADDADPFAVGTRDWYPDGDGDGFGDAGSAPFDSCFGNPGDVTNSQDCDDGTAAVAPGLPEVCDGVDTNCNGLIDAADPGISGADAVFRDDDNDGFGDPAAPGIHCGEGDGWVFDDTDCDPAKPGVFPGATEICDGIDNDCDTQTDELGAVGEQVWYLDNDGDGYGDPLTTDVACDKPPSYTDNPDDCDDLDPAVNPGVLWYQDADGDGFGVTAISQASCGSPGAAWSTTPGDCNDGSALIAPGALEVCNFVDDDCNALVDDNDPGISGQPSWYRDLDGDGYGDLAVPSVGCQGPPGFVFNALDCDDTLPTVNPGMPIEFCNGVDDDCDGLLDEADPQIVDMVAWLPDVDGDGYGDVFASYNLACSGLPGETDQGGDCDDSDPFVSPAEVEVCGDGVDNDCDFAVDSDDFDALGRVQVWLDQDGDGFGDPATPDTRCPTDPGWVTDDTDCEPFVAIAAPGFPELCDGFDNDCDGMVDNPDALDTDTFYQDLDGDGFGDLNIITVACDPPPGFVLDSSDCDDGADNAFPGNTPELCDGVDNDCNGQLDELDPGIADAARYFFDLDGDGYGNTDDFVDACSDPGAPYAPFGGDCDEFDVDVSPGDPELCDGIDNDCDGLFDHLDPSVTGAAMLFFDGDGDGWGDPAVQEFQCPGPSWVPFANDCDDTRADVYGFLAPELCDGVDNNCDGTVDDADPGVQGRLNWWLDADDDGYGDSGGAPELACFAPFLKVPNALDCDDTNPSIRPDSIEVCDGVDNDCDGATDDADPSRIGGTRFYGDSDSDGFGWAPDTIVLCDPLPGLVTDGTDCDDANAALHPGQTVVVSPFGGDFTTIQGAVDNTCTNPTIRIVGGTWPEQVDLGGKRVTLTALDPLDPPVLNPAGAPVLRADSGEPPGTLISNLVIAGTGQPFAQGRGALVSNGAVVTFRGVEFASNRTLGGSGGGAAVTNGGQATFESCRFVGNRADDGGGVLVQNGSGTFLGSTFEGNVAAGGYGGGIEVVDGQLVVVGGEFIANQSPLSSGGAIGALSLFSTVDLYRPSFEGNTGGGPGGTLVMNDIGSASIDGIGIYGGGGMYLSAASNSWGFTLHGSEVIATDETGIRLDGANLSGIVTNVGVLGAADSGIAVTDASVDLVNLTLLGNAAYGADLFLSSGIVRNTIFRGNGTANINDGGHAGLVDWNLWEFAAEQGAYGANNTFGDPLILTWHPNFDPLQWDAHASPYGPAWDLGDPGLLDPDGSRSDIGMYGGPGGDSTFYEDSDSDVLLDGWELVWFGDLLHDGTEDDDGDGWDTLNEMGFGTNPLESDTDGDSALDPLDAEPLDPLVQ